ncbi:hypothetical protein [Pontibacter akesuensis]|uniref:Uncharacterized protein n=1 Tax=Pontibacter akesuensis TaxID=388950 RepID=A0A1I7KQD2_9BACT|nr:hypothetical protein [Pontibacter akesuensis]GHA81419.1 hypothetical protein GCM10007389_39970 [Pontibacter akesuensis]SFU99653.1 hypothetical protein SAMN04487941_3984 [Pontibacter akesuensis]
MLVYEDQVCRLDYATAQGVLVVELSGRQLIVPELRKAFAAVLGLFPGRPHRYRVSVVPAKALDAERVRIRVTFE